MKTIEQKHIDTIKGMADVEVDRDWETSHNP